MSAKKVHIVTRGQYSDYYIVAAFSRKSLAQAYIRDTKAGEYGIEEFDLDPTEFRTPEGYRSWRVRMTITGQVEDVTALIQDFGTTPTPYHHKDMGVFRCYARDKRHAIKIANEQRLQLIESGRWEAAK